MTHCHLTFPRRTCRQLTFCLLAAGHVALLTLFTGPRCGGEGSRIFTLVRYFSELACSFLICLYILSLFNFDYFIVTLFMYLPLLFVSCRLLPRPRKLPGFGICYSCYLPFVFVFFRLLLLPLPAWELSEVIRIICPLYLSSAAFYYVSVESSRPGCYCHTRGPPTCDLYCYLTICFTYLLFASPTGSSASLSILLFLLSSASLTTIYSVLFLCLPWYFFYFLLFLRRLRSQHALPLQKRVPALVDV